MRVRFAVPVVLAGVALSSCGADARETPVERALCGQEDAGDAYQELTRGGFSPGDLAGLAPHPGPQERAFREAGMVRGGFVFLKEVLPRPPFEPPVNLVCEVLEFGTAEEASNFVANMGEGVSVPSLIMGLPPRGVTREIDDGFPRESPAGRVRAFELTTEGEKSASIHIAAANDGVLVRVVAAGREDGGKGSPVGDWDPAWLEWLNGRAAD